MGAEFGGTLWSGWFEVALELVLWFTTFALHATVLCTAAWLLRRPLLQLAPARRATALRWALCGALLSASAQRAVLHPAAEPLRAAAEPLRAAAAQLAADRAHFARDVALRARAALGGVSPADSASVERDAASRGPRATGSGASSMLGRAVADRSADRARAFGSGAAETAGPDGSARAGFAAGLDGTGELGHAAGRFGQVAERDQGLSADGRRLSIEDPVPVEASGLSPTATPAARLGWSLPPGGLALVCLALGLGIAATLLALARGWRLERRIGPRRPIGTGTFAARRLAHLRRVAGAGAVRLTSAERLPVPLVLGGLRPEIVLPARALRECSDDELEAALAHELAHVVRGDLRWAPVELLAGSLLCFHPAARATARRLAAACERAADELAVAWTGRPRAMAAMLTRAGEWLLADPTGGTPEGSAPFPGGARASAMATRPSALVERVESLLRELPEPSRVTLDRWAPAVACALLLLPPIAAQPRPAATSTPAITAAPKDAAPRESHSGPASETAAATLSGPAGVAGGSTGDMPGLLAELSAELRQQAADLGGELERLELLGEAHGRADLAERSAELAERAHSIEERLVRVAELLPRAHAAPTPFSPAHPFPDSSATPVPQPRTR